MRRRVVAIGDLHGDVNRLVRVLERQEILEPGSRTWRRSASRVDVVLLGDYVDWRGEPLEGDKTRWERGVADLMALLVDLHAQVRELQKAIPTFKSRFVTIMGNHDKLMLDSYRYLQTLPDSRVSALSAASGDLTRLRTEARGGSPSLLSRLIPFKRAENPLQVRFRTWIANGGLATMNSFGGFRPWMHKMRDGMVEFMEKELVLGVVINERLYCHTLPDDPRWWRPIEEIVRLLEPDRDEALEDWVWGRKVNGVDYRKGCKVPRPEKIEVMRMLKAMRVKGVVMGHSLMDSLYPVKSYDGLVVNIDTHGHPLSEPWLDEYDEPV